MQSIENDQLSVQINETGAQITHVIAKTGNFDYIWNGTQWTEHVPVLFPAVGPSNDGHYLLAGQRYAMPTDGFANDYPWTVVDKGDDRVSLTLTQNETTLKQYPFNFELMVTYLLEENQIKVSFLVKNNSKTPMPYALGLKPGFNVPINGDALHFEDYALHFDPEVKTLTQFVLNRDWLRTGETIPTADGEQSKLTLRHEVLAKVPVIIANQGLTAVTLNSPRSDHEIALTLEDFPYVALWTLAQTDDKFICIAPLTGLPDLITTTGDWHDKPTNSHLAGKESRQYHLTLTFR